MKEKRLEFEDIKENWKQLPISVKEKKIFCDVCANVRPRKGKRNIKMSNEKLLVCCKRCLVEKVVLMYCKKFNVLIVDEDILEMYGIRKKESKPKSKQFKKRFKDKIQPKEIVAGIVINPYMKVGRKLKQFMERKNVKSR